MPMAGGIRWRCPGRDLNTLTRAIAWAPGKRRKLDPKKMDRALNGCQMPVRLVRAGHRALISGFRAEGEFVTPRA
jgi:hypothetical protein